MFLPFTKALYLDAYRNEVAFNKGKKGIASLSPEYIYYQTFKNEAALKVI